MGLIVDLIEIDSTNPKVAVDPFGVELDEAAKAAIHIAQTSVAQFLESQAPGGLSGVVVNLVDGQLHIQSTAQVVVPVTAQALCSLEIVEGKQLKVVLDEVSPTAGRGIVEAQLERINPVVDTNDLPLNIEMTHIDLSDGWISIYGNVSP